MTDAEISKALALAIGYSPNHVHFKYGITWVFRQDDWSGFDYRDWNVIGPIAERYDCFPLRSETSIGQWVTRVRGNRFSGNFIYEDTPQKTIAMAVIEGAKK